MSLDQFRINQCPIIQIFHSTLTYVAPFDYQKKAPSPQLPLGTPPHNSIIKKIEINELSTGKCLHSREINN